MAVLPLFPVWTTAVMTILVLQHPFSRTTGATQIRASTSQIPTEEEEDPAYALHPLPHPAEYPDLATLPRTLPAAKDWQDTLPRQKDLENFERSWNAVANSPKYYAQRKHLVEYLRNALNSARERILANLQKHGITQGLNLEFPGNGWYLPAYIPIVFILRDLKIPILNWTSSSGGSWALLYSMVNQDLNLAAGVFQTDVEFWKHYAPWFGSFGKTFFPYLSGRTERVDTAVISFLMAKAEKEGRSAELLDWAHNHAYIATKCQKLRKEPKGNNYTSTKDGRDDSVNTIFHSFANLDQLRQALWASGDIIVNLFLAGSSSRGNVIDGYGNPPLGPEDGYGCYDGGLIAEMPVVNKVNHENNQGPAAGAAADSFIPTEGTTKADAGEKVYQYSAAQEYSATRPTLQYWPLAQYSLSSGPPSTFVTEQTLECFWKEGVDTAIETLLSESLVGGDIWGEKSPESRHPSCRGSHALSKLGKMHIRSAADISEKKNEDEGDFDNNGGKDFPGHVMFPTKERDQTEDTLFIDLTKLAQTSQFAETNSDLSTRIRESLK